MRVSTTKTHILDRNELAKVLKLNDDHLITEVSWTGGEVGHLKVVTGSPRKTEVVNAAYTDDFIRRVKKSVLTLW